MAKLDAADRNALPAKDFGLPEKRAFPEEDRGHADAAKGRAEQALKRGHINKSQYDRIVAKANKVLANG